MNRSLDPLSESSSDLSLRQDKLCKDTSRKSINTESINAHSLGSPAFLLRLAENSQTPQHILERLCHRPEIELRLALTENPSTPSSVLTLLAFDSSVDVRFQLAENHNVSPSILEILEADDNPYVSCRAAKTLARLKAGAAAVLIA